MRDFKGVKSRLAIEFSGWTGKSKAFAWAYRGSDQTPSVQRQFTAMEIRAIRFDLQGIAVGTQRPLKVPPVITSRMAKGGVGKTTITANISTCMAMMGFKVLMIDGDPQASLSGVFGIDWSEQDVTHVGELMRRANKGDPVYAAEAVIPMYSGNMLDLIPASIDMANSDQWLTTVLDRGSAFTDLLEKEVAFFSQYDVIVVDSAPSSSLLTTSMMVASPTILAVITPEGQSLGALTSLESNVQEINKYLKTRAHTVHIVVNRYNQSKKPHQIILGQLFSTHSAYLNDTIVRDFVGFLRENVGRDIAKVGPLIENEPNSIGSRDIIELTKSLLKLYGITLPGSPV